MINDIDNVLAALGGISGVQLVTRGWPKTDPATAKLPAIAVQEAGNRPAAHADDDELVTEIEYYIRVFARTAGECDTLIVAAETVLRQIGYKRTFSYEDFGADVKMKVLRMRAYM